MSRERSSLELSSSDYFRLWAILIDSLLVLVRLSRRDLFSRMFPEELPS